MCLAIPAKVLKKDGVNIALVNVKVGEYVIVHAGFAIEVMNEVEAKETLHLWSELLTQNK